MSANLFARTTTSTVPFEDGAVFVIRRLTGVELEKAQAAHLKSFVNGRSPRGWSGALTRILNGAGVPSDLDAVKADPLAGFDRLAVAKFGIVSLNDEAVPPAIEATDPHLADGFTDEALEFVAREVIRLTKPNLFLTPEQQTDARKNDSGSSTSA
jgi:hypothetical protein